MEHPVTAAQFTSHVLIPAARLWYDAGYAVIPSHEDGSKRPFGQWKQYQDKRPAWAELEAWLETGRYSGIGVITGAVSGGVEMIEVEGPIEKAVTRIKEIKMKAEGLDAAALELWMHVATGCVEQSAGGGLHMFMTVTGGPPLGNTKLAMQGQGVTRHVVSETRGEGGFVVVAPTPARNGHEPDATYLFLTGSTPANTPAITIEQRDDLHMLIGLALDEDDEREVAAMLAAQAAKVTAPKSQNAPFQVSAPVESTFGNYRQGTTWAEILGPQGWQFSHHSSDGRDHWVRPGKTIHEGTSATTIEDGPMYVFSSSTSFPQETGMSKEYVYAHLHHSGDLAGASRALRDQGFGGVGETYEQLKEFIPIHPTGDMGGISVQEFAEETPYDRAVRNKYAEYKIAEDARMLLAVNKMGQAPTMSSINLTDFLAQPDSPVSYRIEGLWPSDGRVLLAAAAKSGKTTLIASNLIPAIVDGGLFLGNKVTQPLTPGKTIIYFNMEVSENTLRKWMRDAGIRNTAAIHVVNLRGKASAFQLGTPQGRARLTAYLMHHNVEIVILDPLAPMLAALGLDENSNAEVAQFFGWWAESLTAAGVKDDVIVHHTGHAGQRSRGASRLLDEPDAIWTLTKDADDDDDDGGDFSSMELPTRYLAAYGRDVEMSTEALAYDPFTRRLTLTGEGKKTNSDSRLRQKAVKALTPQLMMTKNQIQIAMGGNRNTAGRIIDEMIADGTVFDTGKKGAGGGKVWTLG